MHVQRVAVVGCAGAGKSTFARELGRRTGLPVIHLDRHFWHPGWVETPRDEWRRVQTELLSGDEWIVDGNYGGTHDIRLSRADTVVVMAPPRRVCMTRVLRRSFSNWGRAIQADGCPERFDKEFLQWVWRWPYDSRPRLDAALAEHGQHLHIVELTSSSAVQSFLDNVAP